MPALVWAGLAAYGLAKALEILDAQVYGLLGCISGHPLKHVVAALALVMFVLALRYRHAVRLPDFDA